MLFREEQLFDVDDRFTSGEMIGWLLKEKFWPKKYIEIFVSPSNERLGVISENNENWSP